MLRSRRYYHDITAAAVTAAARLTGQIMAQLMRRTQGPDDEVFHDVEVYVGSIDIDYIDDIDTQAYLHLAREITSAIARYRDSHIDGEPRPQGSRERQLELCRDALILAHRRYAVLQTE